MFANRHDSLYFQLRVNNKSMFTKYIVRDFDKLDEMRVISKSEYLFLAIQGKIYYNVETVRRYK